VRLFSGQRAFVLQRLSALALLACLAGATLRLAFGAPVTLQQWQAWAAQPAGAAALLVVAAAVIVHAWVGARDVVLDYVRPFSLRLTVLSLIAVALALVGAWTAFILVRHAL
jgi:succinate dehydrogenase / fumarate reductase membrane anchor subunit